jgi:hypothetical protein
MPSPEASRRNLAKIRRCRSASESLIIKRLICQSVVGSGPNVTQRQLARELGLSQPYVCKIAKRWGNEGMPTMLAHPEPVTFDDLARAREYRRLTG